MKWTDAVVILGLLALIGWLGYWVINCAAYHTP